MTTLRCGHDAFARAYRVLIVLVGLFVILPALLVAVGVFLAHLPPMLLLYFCGVVVLVLCLKTSDTRARATSEAHEATLRELQAIRARLDACTPPPPPPSYRWDYRTGEWRPMPEGDDV